jgi:hypothetical protein
MSQATRLNLSDNDDNVHTDAHTACPPNLTTLKFLADEIRAELTDLEEHDTIHACGKAALAILKFNPPEALQLAKDHVQNQPYREVRRCWLRLYEDASLWRAAELLCYVSGRSRLASDGASEQDDWMSLVVRVLDLGLVVSGGTLRGELYEAIFANLQAFVREEDHAGSLSTAFSVVEPKALISKHVVAIASRPSLEDFQIHLNGHMTPLLLTNTIDDWPAMRTWQDPFHLLRLTLGGRRCVPVEIGETYTHADHAPPQVHARLPVAQRTERNRVPRPA